ncbi:hypothetical protein CL1_1113 [Thermococcus cleftensis]|uniref:Uncharacterized protein n=1 Tax=Thermococcus cleftensis (strain DSM 27260 / KACC 17922 / CL1) TaxID=163003 RepID=I3ZUD2_THECF|nr:hypothetical protein [Thermococcus cleftensis]AFL95316.1 hypothetical protein CL1_1113 [Thermococcus cleftensis]
MNRVALVLLLLIFSAIIGGYYLTHGPEKTEITLKPVYPTEIYTSKVKPLVEKWTDDAELILVYGSEHCQHILCDLHPMSSPCICNDSTFGDGRAPQWTFIFYSEQKGELIKVDAYIVGEGGQKRWQVVSKTYGTPLNYSSLDTSLSNPPENHTSKPGVYILFRNQWKFSLRPLNITATNFTEFKRLILAESKSPTVYGGVLILPDRKIGDLKSPTIIIRTQFNQTRDIVTVVYPGAVLRGYVPPLPCKPTSLESYSQSVSTVIERLTSPEFSELKLILGQPYAYYKLENGTIKIETLDCEFEVNDEDIKGACRTR